MKWNEINSINSKIRIKDAYEHWLSTNKKSIRASSKLFKTKPTSVKNYAIEQGHTFTSHDVTIFNKIDTEEKAYWLGFLYADGSVSSSSNNVEISLKEEDISHLEKFKLFAKCTNNVSVSQAKIEEKVYKRCRIALGSKEIKTDLMNLGCIPNKTFIVQFPYKIDRNFYSAFIRGVFDGDGSISRDCKECMYNTASLASGSLIFLEQISKILFEECNITCKPYKISKKSNTYVLIFSKLNFKKLMKYLYFDSTIHLDRKYERYINSIAILN